MILLLSLPWLLLIASVWIIQTRLLLHNLLTYEALRQDTRPDTWPWYFQSIAKTGPWQSPPATALIQPAHFNPFYQTLALNAVRFIRLSCKAMQAPRRGWKRRWRLGGAIVPFPEDAGPLQEKWQEREDGWVQELYRPEVEEVVIDASWAFSLQVALQTSVSDRV